MSPSPSDSCIVLLAHGARDPRWADPFHAVVREVQRRSPGSRVVLSFLEFMSPTLPQAAEQAIADGALRLEVVPLFLGAGGHVRKDVPPMLEALRERHAEVRVTLHPAIGEWESVVQAMADAVVSAAA